ncbi:MAG TPA: tRNA uridine-5-carboxymethylaminomethyl(34) synthesis GTPase MnmE, partial [Chthoniobacterales bacterium]|nr:tRNA uridine-5-carboxymethylaminomethyl(34) synthesis GTPase MnmE [Chthoniobacterales bacterium]
MDCLDTIAAISTPIGEGAIAVIRLSGSSALTVLGRIFVGNVAPEAFVPRRIVLGSLHD